MLVRSNPILLELEKGNLNKTWIYEHITNKKGNKKTRIKIIFLLWTMKMNFYKKENKKKKDKN